MGNSISAVVCNRGLDLIGDRPLLQVCNLKKVLDCRVLQTHFLLHRDTRRHTQRDTSFHTQTPGQTAAQAATDTDIATVKAAHLSGKQHLYR